VLGTLLSPTKFDTRAGRTYFVRYWETYLYPNDPARKAAAPGVYSLARNGVAHVFTVKGPIAVAKGEPSYHLKRSAGGEVYIDAVQLAVDFADSYVLFRRDTDQSPALPSQRLTEMCDAYVAFAHGMRGADGDMEYFKNLPLAPAQPPGTTTTTPAPRPPGSAATVALTESFLKK
jgi:hypothetical protein